MLPPRVVRSRHRQVGFGDYTDFASLIAAEPAAAHAWQTQVQSQLTAEGNGPGSPIAQVAQGHFYSVWSNLASVVPTGGSTGNAALGTIANAAATLTVQNNTSAGAVQLVEGLAQGAIDGNPAEIMQAFTGSLCAFAGAEVAAGAISFGIGAAIMVGIELVGDLLSSAFFSKAPVVATVCGAQITGTKPGIIVNCVFSQGQPVSPGYGQLGSTTAPKSSPFWRRFPEPNNTADAWWFTPVKSGTMAVTSWTSNKSTDVWTAVAQGIRPIDAAFPQYHQLECDAAAAYPVASLYDTGNGTYSADDVMFARFILAYFGAWKANAEFSLNGMTPTYATDADVLMGGTGGLGGALGFWNAAHQPGATRTLTPRDTNKGFTDVVVYPSPCAGSFENEWWYVSMLLNDGNVDSVSVNTGPKVSYTLASSSSGMSTAKKVAIGAAGAVGSVALVGTVGAVGLAAYQGLPWHHYLSELGASAARVLGRR